MPAAGQSKTEPPKRRETASTTSGPSPGPLVSRDPAPEKPDSGSGGVLDRRRLDKLRRGKIMPQARIDLHGMTAARAHPELVDFILNRHAQGLRLVLVITGKGSARHEDDSIMPSRRGVLRHSVPQWLTHAPLGPLILQITPAHARHGGGGAFYVYLRRTRR